MKKKQAVIVMLAAAMMVMTGCSAQSGAVTLGNTQEVLASEKSMQEDISTGKESIPEKYTKTIGNIEFQFETIFPKEWKESGVYKTKAERITFSKEKLEQGLGTVSYDYEEWKQKKEGGYLSADDYAIMYYTALGEQIMEGIDLDARDGNIEQYIGECSFMTEQEAYEKVLNTLQSIGMELQDTEYTCYALDTECYLFLIRQKVQGAVEYHRYGTEFVRMEACNAPIKVLYSKDGIERLDIEKVYRFTKEDEKIALADFEEITKTVCDELKNRNESSAYRIESAQLCMRTPAIGTEMTPVWVFQSKETTKEGDVYPVTVVIDAKTAKLSAIGTR